MRSNRWFNADANTGHAVGTFKAGAGCVAGRCGARRTTPTATPHLVLLIKLTAPGFVWT